MIKVAILRSGLFEYWLLFFVPDLLIFVQYLSTFVQKIQNFFQAFVQTF